MEREQNGAEVRRELEIGYSVFGNTIAKVVEALDGLPLRGVITVRTNDP